MRWEEADRGKAWAGALADGSGKAGGRIGVARPPGGRDKELGKTATEGRQRAQGEGGARGREEIEEERSERRSVWITAWAKRESEWLT